jgi:hypothetical protein
MPEDGQRGVLGETWPTREKKLSLVEERKSTRGGLAVTKKDVYELFKTTRKERIII